MEDAHAPTLAGPPRSAVARELEPGTIVGGRYEVGRRLSAGGMGVVYQARHTSLDSQVALKVLLRPDEEEARQRFLLEAQLASKIHHPNTVYIADFGFLPDGRPYIAMEFLAGPTLSKVIEGGPLDVLRACRIALQTARGLHAVHEQGIVHRDLKPDNIFLLPGDDDRDFVKIVDFGIARRDGAAPAAEARGEAPPRPDGASGRLTLAGTVMGTPHYMSPEQAMGQETDGRTDQYALGCILFEMLTGKVPYDHPDSMTAVMLKHVNAPLPSLAGPGATALPPALEGVILRLLAKDAQARFPSMKALDQALSEICERLAYERGERRLPPLGRRRALLLIAPSLVLLIVSGVLGWGRLLERLQPKISAAELGALRRRALAVLHGDLRDPVLRVPALVAISESRDVEQRVPVEPLLKVEDTASQAQAADTLSQLGDRRSLPALRGALSIALAPLAAASVAGALERLGDEEGRRRLVEVLQGAGREGRTQAALLLGPRGVPAASAALRAFAEGRGADEGMAALALERLAQEGDRAALERLRALLRAAPRRDQQLGYAGRLARLGDPEGRAFLRGLAGRPGPDQLPAARLLSAPDEAGFGALFRRVLKARDATTAARLLAAEGLGLCGELPDALLLAPLLSEQTAPVLRQAAALGVLRISLSDPATLSEQSLSWARGAAVDASAIVRQSAASALADLPAASAVPLLTALLRDVEVKVRKSASRALGRRRERAALLALRESLADSDEGVRRESLRSLGAIGQRLLQSGARSVALELAGWLKDVVDRGAPAERLLASLLLMRMGDEGQRSRVRAFQGDKEPEVRRILVEQVDGEPALLSAALSDPSREVRFAAARRLAEQSDRRGVPILREAVLEGGKDAVVAHGLLRRLGEDAPPLPALRQPVAELPTEQRLALLESAALLPPAEAAALLLAAARDPELSVRRAAAEAALSLGARGRPALRILSGDLDPATRARAAAALSGLLTTATTKEQEPAQVVPPRPAPSGPARTAAPPAAPAPAAPPAAATPVAPAAPPPSPPAGADERPPQEVRPDGGRQEPPRNEVKALIDRGALALARRDLRQAEKLLEKAHRLCERSRRLADLCAGLRPDLLYHLARTYEAEERFAEAMTDYEKLSLLRARLRPDRLAELQRATARLSPRLGRIVVPQRARGRCTEVSIWAPPGSHAIDLDGTQELVRIRARETVKVGSCD